MEIDLAWREADAEWEAAGRELAAAAQAVRRRDGHGLGPGAATPSGWRVLARTSLEERGGWGAHDLWALQAPPRPGGGTDGPGRVLLVATKAHAPYRPLEASTRTRE